ncbi:MAG TPA: hypothetical protein PLY93_13350 [Turneriella sp.]|nr:hypothetical protein [Turneriella sp.]
MVEANIQCIALVGAGPSLDLCLDVMNTLVARGAFFCVADSVAVAFQKKFPQTPFCVFTVETRRHAYLLRLKKNPAAPVTLWAYHNANARNLIKFHQGYTIQRFKLVGEEGGLPTLYSPGTVFGVMLAFAMERIAPRGEIHLIGADFSYLDQRIYTRFLEPHTPLTTRLFTREIWQLEMVFKKTSQVILKHGVVVRTSFEFLNARENIRAFVERLGEGVRLVEYSPLGVDTAWVEKRAPF